MNVACWCGALFDADGDIGICPRCHELAVIPAVTDRDQQAMRAELDALTADHKEPPMPDPQFILYTYALSGGQQICHTYGPADQASAQAEGEKLQAAAENDPAGFSEFSFMVLPLEAMPS